MLPGGPFSEQKAQAELLRLLAIPSETGHEQAIIAYLESRLEALGLQTFRQKVAEGRENLIWTSHPHPKLLITAHVDTVPLKEQQGLVQQRVEDGYVFGKGSADVKGGIAALLLALESMAGQGLETASIAVAFTVDEEQGGAGSRVLPEAIQAEGAVVLEPTGLALCTAQAGSLEVRITLMGRSAHGSAFEAGENAIHKAAALIEKFRSLRFVQATHFLVGSGGFNVMEIRGGQHLLVVPDRCELYVDFRILPGQDIALAEQEVRTLLSQEEAALEVLDVSPPYALRGTEMIVELLQEACKEVLGREAPFRGMPSWTDAQHLYSAGIPAVIFGPGDLAVSHTPWEHVSLEEVVQAARVLARAMEKTALLPSPS
ncbi:MAG: M20/M25/M40 family metallo-hydrolase [Armatimonadota bacterium]|nr:M20/M25/M40 family metallo-hydrolase [Armatimonadota bacterium]MDR5703442.1 M20/M25/M40 family metallo-hydrolase [Armatimonadota bacterium]